MAIAREAIECALKRTQFQHPIPTAEGLAQPSGAFVTIRREGELRGCIGYIESEKPVADVVAEVAAKAATEDLRFLPMTLAELEHATFEISILSPLRRVSSPEEIIVGVHGLVVALGNRRGLLLPQVATEHHLGREAFLEATLRKAGIPPALWVAPDIEVYVFEAEVIQEADVLQ